MSDERVTWVEIDVDKCVQRWGVGTFEPTIAPTITRASGDEVLSTDIDRQQSLLVAVDLAFAAEPDGIIWEQGSTAAGAYLGVTDGQLVFRAGLGDVPPSPRIAQVRTPASQFAGQTVKIIAEIIVPDRVRLRVISSSGDLLLQRDGVASDTIIIGAGAAWSGGNAGAIGVLGGGAAVVGESTANWNGTITQARFYAGEFALNCGASLSARSPNKCVNGFKTCRFTTSYQAEPVTLVLTMQKQVGLPIAGRHFPVLTQVKESEQTVNIAGSDPRLAALGKRASVTIEGLDLIYEDRFLDPYFDERLTGAAQFNGVGYEPVGMFFERLHGRDPFFAGYPMRVNQGRVVDGELVADRTTHYLMTEFDPSGGKVRWKGVDVLDLASNDRALVPTPSRGRLADDIGDAQTEITLTPEGIGDEYAAFGYVTIGREIMRFTRAGDVLTVVRGLFNTQPASHKFAAGVQESFRYTGKAHEAARDLLALAKVPGSWVPFQEWADEASIWFDVDVDTIITQPMPVSEALGELSILGFSLYTDLAAQKIRFKPNRFLFSDELDDAPTITDDDIIGQLEYDGRDSDRLTRVEFRSVQFDPTRGLSDDNFDQQHLSIAGDSEDPRAYGDIRYNLEKTRWLNQGRNALVRILANRYLRRFKTPPEIVKLRVKRRKYGAIELTQIVKFRSRHIPSQYAQIESRLFQVKKREDANAGEIILTLQRFEYAGNFGFWAPNDAPDYADATEAQKSRMAFWGPNTGDTFADGRPLYEWG